MYPLFWRWDGLIPYRSGRATLSPLQSGAFGVVGKYRSRWFPRLGLTWPTGSSLVVLTKPIETHPERAGCVHSGPMVKAITHKEDGCKSGSKGHNDLVDWCCQSIWILQYGRRLRTLAFWSNDVVPRCLRYVRLMTSTTTPGAGEGGNS